MHCMYIHLNIDVTEFTVLVQLMPIFCLYNENIYIYMYMYMYFVFPTGNLMHNANIIIIYLFLDNENLIFRGNTFATKAVDTYMKMVGEAVRNTCTCTCTCIDLLFTCTCTMYVHV